MNYLNCTISNVLFFLSWVKIGYFAPQKIWLRFGVVVTFTDISIKPDGWVSSKDENGIPEFDCYV